MTLWIPGLFLPGSVLPHWPPMPSVRLAHCCSRVQNSITQVSIYEVDKQDCRNFCTSGIDGAMTIWDFKTLESSIQGLRIMWSWASLQTQHEDGPAVPGQRCHVTGRGARRQETLKTHMAQTSLCVLFEYNWWKCWFFKSNSDFGFVLGVVLFCFAISFHSWPKLLFK